MCAVQLTCHNRLRNWKEVNEVSCRVMAECCHGTVGCEWHRKGELTDTANHYQTGCRHRWHSRTWCQRQTLKTQLFTVGDGRNKSELGNRNMSSMRKPHIVKLLKLSNNLLSSRKATYSNLFINFQKSTVHLLVYWRLSLLLWEHPSHRLV